MKNNTTLRNIVISGTLLSAGLTAIIALTAASLVRFSIVGPTVPFQYPWRLTDPTTLSRLTAWGGYVLHNLIVWGFIFAAKRQRPRYASGFRWFNWGLLATNGLFIGLHILQTQFFYDGLAQDVPEITALGSVALLLMVVLILETPRRGLIFGKKVKFHEKFLKIVREYHGYLFSWAIIYTFWYHPTAGTIGHLAGFFYMFMLLWQSVLIFNRAHLNKWWTFTIEALVLPHGVLVAINQGNNTWPMFAFGFGAMIVLTQMYGLGLGTWTKRAIAALFVVAVMVVYILPGHFIQMNEIIRIPFLDYMVVALLYGIFLGGDRLYRLFGRQRRQLAEAGTD